MARARRAGRSASSMRWDRTISAPSRSPEKLRRIDDIGGPDTHTNFPHGWAMASNTPLRRYKQNTHGGGIRDPFVMSLAEAGAGEGRTAPSVRARLRPRADAARTGRHRRAAEIAGCAQMPIEGESFARSIRRRLRAVKILTAIFRDVRASRPLAPAAGRRSPTIRRARRSRTTNGSCFISTAISPKSMTSRRKSPHASPK